MPVGQMEPSANKYGEKKQSSQRACPHSFLYRPKQHMVRRDSRSDNGMVVERVRESAAKGQGDTAMTMIRGGGDA